jgi:hypothetical protein
MLKSTIALAALMAALAGPALASDDDRYESGDRYERSSGGGRCTARPVAEWLSIGQVAVKLEERGFTVREIETSHGCYEVKATDGKGNRIKVYIDPATAEVVSRARRG